MASVSQPEMMSVRRRALVPANHARSILISKNPRAGSKARHDHLSEVSVALARAGYEVQSTTDLAELRDLANKGFAKGSLRAVVSIGGDGTASVVRNHTPLEVPQLIVPMGTENLLGKYLGQKIDPDAICDTTENGVVVEFDLGRAGNKYFLLMLSAGFDAEVIRHLHENRRGNITHLSYFRPTLRTVCRYRYPQLRVYWTSDGAESVESSSCRWLFGFNFPLYALGLPIAPHATATDGQLDVCTFERGAVWSVARYLWHIVRRMHADLPDSNMRQARSFRLEADGDATVYYQVDGDYGGTLPVDVDVLPGQLRLLVSRAAATRLGFAVPV